MKYKKLLVWMFMLVIVSSFTVVPFVKGATITPTGPTNIENVPLSVLSVIGKITDWGHAIFDRLFSHRKLGATILTTNSTDTIGTFRTNTNTNFNTLNAAISDTTSSLGIFASLASTTGNLIVGSSTLWRAMVVGSNGSVLTVSSTAPGSLAWVSAGSGVTSLNGSTSSTQTFATSGTGLVISTLNGVHTFQNTAPNNNSTTTLSGSTYISVTNGGIGATTINLNITPVSSTRAISAGAGLLGGGDLSADRTIYWNPVQTTSTISTATTTNLSVSSTLYFANDSTKQSTAYKSSGFTVVNATTTTSSTMTMQREFYQAFKLAQLDCSSDGPTITISAFVRASSTPSTNGTTTFANIACTSSGFSTTTFTNANFGANQYLAFASSSVSDATSTLVVSFKYQEQ